MTTTFIEMTNNVQSIRRELSNEVLQQTRLPDQGWKRHLVESLMSIPLHQPARIAEEFDHWVGEAGLRTAAQRVLPHFVKDVQVSGADSIPLTGPILIASNHPGTIDTLILLAHVPRQDIRILAQETPFLRSLQHTQKNLIFFQDSIPSRVTAARAALRHLQAGGALILHPSGRLDPDPYIMHGSWESIERWSSSLDLFLSRAPETRVQVALMGGLLDRESLDFPLVQSIEGVRQRQVTAEIAQISRQLFLQRPADRIPSLFLSKPQTIQELIRGTDLGLRDILVQNAQRMLVANLY